MQGNAIDRDGKDWPILLLFFIFCVWCDCGVVLRRSCMLILVPFGGLVLRWYLFVDILVQFPSPRRYAPETPGMILPGSPKGLVGFGAFGSGLAQRVNCKAMQLNAVQCQGMRCTALQFIATQRDTMQLDEMQCYSMQ